MSVAIQCPTCIDRWGWRGAARAVLPHPACHRHAVRHWPESLGIHAVGEATGPVGPSQPLSVPPGAPPVALRPVMDPHAGTLPVVGVGTARTERTASEFAAVDALVHYCATRPIRAPLHWGRSTDFVDAIGPKVHHESDGWWVESIDISGGRALLRAEAIDAAGHAGVTAGIGIADDASTAKRVALLSLARGLGLAALWSQPLRVRWRPRASGIVAALAALGMEPWCCAVRFRLAGETLVVVACLARSKRLSGPVVGLVSGAGTGTRLDDASHKALIETYVRAVRWRAFVEDGGSAEAMEPGMPRRLDDELFYLDPVNAERLWRAWGGPTATVLDTPPSVGQIQRTDLDQQSVGWVDRGDVATDAIGCAVVQALSVTTPPLSRMPLGPFGHAWPVPFP